MRIILTGVTGYVGKRLLPVLIRDGHEVICLTRDKDRLNLPAWQREGVEIAEADFASGNAGQIAAVNADAAFYLIHSLAASTENLEEHESMVASNFRSFAERCGVKQVIYLGGISNDERLSPHLSSRKKVSEVLSKGDFALTTLKASMIVGSGSASFEIIRDIVEKLPLMILPSWTRSLAQPIGIRDVLIALSSALGKEEYYDKEYDIGGRDRMTYAELLKGYAEVRDLNRLFVPVPFLSPKLSSYWLYFVTATNFRLANNLVDSLKNDMVCADNEYFESLGHEPMGYKEAVKQAFMKIEQNAIISSWKDAFNSTTEIGHLKSYVRVPENGCYKDERKVEIRGEREQVLENIWSIGGDRGWYYGNSLWRIRGFMDKLVGGVGLRRGRTNPEHVKPGDALDFWRVILADKDEGRLLLFAEMKLPGEAWLEFRIEDENDKLFLVQTATFRPKGLFGRLYWYILIPAHHFIFSRMARNIADFIPDNGKSRMRKRAEKIRMAKDEM